MEGAVRRAAASAPGKAILHGEHAAVYGELAVAASLGLRTFVSVSEEDSSSSPAVVRISSPSVGLDESLPALAVRRLLAAPTAGRSRGAPRELDHERHLAAVDDFIASIKPDLTENANEAQKNSLRVFLYLLAGILGDAGGEARGAGRGLRVRVRSELAAGAGAGSSAAFGVALAAALLRLARPGASRGLGLELGLEDRRLASAWAYNCERIVHGTPSGVDNSTCAFGSLVSFRKGEEPRQVELLVGLRVLLVDTRVSRHTKAMAERVAALRRRNEAAVDCVMAACGHLAGTALRALQETRDAAALHRQLAELWDMNHCLLAALGVSHAALEAVRAAAARRGLPAKLTGAGGGGFALVLVPPDACEDNVQALCDELRRDGYDVHDTQLGGPGVALHH